jgi:hypothetical protein
VDGPPVHPDSTPPWLIVRYQHPARGDQPPVTLTWYHGGKQPSLLPDDLKAKWKSGVLFVGAKGMLLADYGHHTLLPEKDFAGFVPPVPFVKDSIGHHNEWIAACKTGGPTTCSFDYPPLTKPLCRQRGLSLGKTEWDTKNCARPTVPKPTNSSNITTAKLEAGVAQSKIKKRE